MSESTPTVLCYVYEQMADFEITLLLNILKQRGGRRVVAISEGRKPVTAQSGLVFQPDMGIDEVSDELAQEAEALIIPGGPIDMERNAICPLIRRRVDAGRLVGAICFAPQFLGRAGVLDDHRFTTSCPPKHIEELGVESPFPWKNFVQARVLRDGPVITAQGNAFVDFAEAVCDAVGMFESSAECKRWLDGYRQ